MPKKYFSKTRTSYIESFLSFLLIVFFNLFAYRRLLQRILSFYGFDALLFLVLVPVFLFFVLFGMDLFFIKQDKDHWFKTHYGPTFVPYLFLPLAMPIAVNSYWYYRLSGWIIIVSLVIWSLSLFAMISRSIKFILIRGLRDVVMIYLLYRLF